MIYWLWGKLSKAKRAVVQWHYRNRPPPYKTIPGADPLGNEPGETMVVFVSRHDLAECGLKCEGCRAIVADRGDFSTVVTSQYGEAVNCAKCERWLVASPDTEHGDDLLPYDHQEFHRFKRISGAQAVRERYGEDMEREDGRLQANRIRLGDVAAEMNQPEDDPQSRDTKTTQES